MIRGIAGNQIFRGVQDREDFITRTGEVAQETGTRVLAWVLMSNHAHFLLFSGPSGIAKFMRRILTGYAQGYNRRHGRSGHLFQNRYKSIVCEEDPYLLELVRYIHLNPYRASVVKSLEELDAYPWSGHAVLIGNVKNDWQERDYVLRQFHEKKGKAVRFYRRFVEVGKDQGRQPALVGGGVIQNFKGWSQVLSLKGNRERMDHDGRILGTSDFVAEILREADKNVRRYVRRSERESLINDLIKKTANEEGVGEQELRMGGQTRKISKVRAMLSFQLNHKFGVSMAEIARYLGVCTSAVAKAVRKIEATQKE
jgi:REP element-mobilizing transposase RayT